QMIEWLAHQKLPAILVATKADKLGRSRRMEQRKRMAEALKVEPDRIVLFSAKSRLGRPELWRAIRAACEEEV
ncbi:MAG: YihA family ribosome biogenesis GTP-binding protein, partial [bacterium]|nr:YihA family ribosome biogenesis GTP-binding protein [bacterium]